MITVYATVNILIAALWLKYGQCLPIMLADILHAAIFRCLQLLFFNFFQAQNCLRPVAVLCVGQNHHICVKPAYSIGDLYGVSYRINM